MSDKTFVFENGSDSNMMGMLSGLMGKNSMDPNLVAALMNGRNNQDQFGGGCWFIWIILLFALWGRNGLGGFGGGDSALPAALQGDAGRDLLMQAIQGNGNAISQLSSQLHCDINSLQSGLSSVNNTLTSLGGQIGMSGQQIINSIQMGNNQLSSQLADCCCKTQNAITTQGYENQLATVNQTTTLVNTMNTNNRSVLDRIDAFEKNQMLDKIDKLREEKSTLLTEISQRNQNEYFASLIAPINARLGQIECRTPPTFPVPYAPGIPMATYQVPYCASAFGAGVAAGEAISGNTNW